MATNVCERTAYARILGWKVHDFCSGWGVLWESAETQTAVQCREVLAATVSFGWCPSHRCEPDCAAVPRLAEYARGTLVRAVRVPPDAAEVAPGTLGVVFEESDAYGDGGGPMVRWTTGAACNVYDGWVERLTI